MGVSQLWPILHPCARPTKLETLNRKRLAVDASIWIYQFLKAVRDKEGNALRNSHVVGFFRRICKLLFFGIKPVFVFDGGAPALKRQTVLRRKQRREGRRDDAVRTAGKLLAVQMQRRAEEDDERRKRQAVVRGRAVDPQEDEEEIPDDRDLVYVDEFGMTSQERQQTRKFTKKDAYHLPELDGGISNMGQPNDPRIMSAEELEEYARQFNSGEDINLYDFSKIDFNGEFFTSLPPGDRYNILNAARLRSRLRMGLSKDQLEEMFPDRMAFSRFQIERVRERNELTQRLMNLNGMNDENAMFGVGGGRIAGERGREYVLVKNEGVEGGWALGVVSIDKAQGERDKPIDVDALHQKLKEQKTETWDDEDDFEDVPIEGLNRLPKIKAPELGPRYQARQTGQVLPSTKETGRSVSRHASPENHSLFMAGEDSQEPFLELRRPTNTFEEQDYDEEEEEELKRAIAMSLQKHHGSASDSENDNADFENVLPPVFHQQAVEAPRPLPKSNGQMVAHIVNNRANAAMPRRRAPSNSSDDEMDLQSALAASRKGNTASEIRPQLAPLPRNTKNPFDGPLPFEKLDFKTSLFGNKVPTHAKPAQVEKSAADEDFDMAGGFERDAEEEVSKPLPPWLVKNGDIRSDVREQKAKDLEIDAEDRERALEERRLYARDQGIIQIDSSDEEGSDVEILDQAPFIRGKSREHKSKGSIQPRLDHEAREEETTGDLSEDVRARSQTSDVLQDEQPSPKNITESVGPSEEEEVFMEWSDSDREDLQRKPPRGMDSEGMATDQVQVLPSGSKSLTPKDSPASQHETPVASGRNKSPMLEDFNLRDENPSTLPFIPNFPTVPDGETREPTDVVSDVDFDEFSDPDPDDEELLVQLAAEAEEHARFASTLNHRSERENQDAYEQELKQLRNQQKKDRRDADEVSHIMITECQALLRLFGIPYITAPMEAEAQCAELVNLGLVDGIVTDDSDIFLFGGTRVYKNMFNNNKFVECYLSSDLEKELSLSRDQLIAIAHLLGSDYTEGLPGIGPVSALEILSEFPAATGLQEFKEWWADVQINGRPKEADTGSTFRKKFRKAQGTKLFLPPAFPSIAVTEAYLKPDVDSTPEPFQWGIPDLDNLRSFLMATIGWSQERTDEVLVPVIKDMNRRETEGTQSNITRYFEGGVGVGAREGFAPRVRDTGSIRMKEAVKKLKAKTGNAIALQTTFGDEAADWAKRNELSESAQMTREKTKKGRGTGKRAAVVAVEEEGDFENQEGDDENEDNDGEKSTKQVKARRKRKKTTD